MTRGAETATVTISRRAVVLVREIAAANGITPRQYLEALLHLRRVLPQSAGVMGGGHPIRPPDVPSRGLPRRHVVLTERMAAIAAILAPHQQAATVVSYNSQDRRRRPLAGVLGAQPVGEPPDRPRASGAALRGGVGEADQR
jgi:hypothetical protein